MPESCVPRRIVARNLKDAFSVPVYPANDSPRKQAELIHHMLAHLAGDLVPHRPGRSEPRTKKEGPKPINCSPNPGTK